jgi:hypothetical protein
MDPVRSIESSSRHAVYSNVSHDSLIISMNIIECLSFCNGDTLVCAGIAKLFSDSLRAGRSEDRIPVRAKFSAPASCTVGTDSLFL